MTGKLGCGCYIVDGVIVRFCEEAKRLADTVLSLPDKSPERREAGLEYLRHTGRIEKARGNDG